MGQQVAQLHDRYMMIMTKTIKNISTLIISNVFEIQLYVRLAMTI